MKNKKIAILGGGNIGTGIALGLIRSKLISNKNITVTQLPELFYTNKELEDEGVKLAPVSDNAKVVAKADIVFACVKPWIMHGLLNDIKDSLTSGQKLFASVAAGFEIKSIKDIIGNDAVVFRVMPNTAMKIQESMTCIASNDATNEDEELMLKIFGEMGEAIMIPEMNMMAATVLCSSGTAFVMKFMHALMQGGVESGFSAKDAQYIVSQTVKGAAEILLKSDTHPALEIDKVTTPAGTTIKGLNAMEDNGFSASVIQGILRANGLE